MMEHIDGGVVLTGGMTKIKGIEELAKKVFHPTPVRISNPINIRNGYIDFNNPTMSTIVGLLKYALNSDPSLELNSKRELRHKVEIKKTQQPQIQSNELDESKDEQISGIGLETSSKKASIWNKIGQWL
jgi:cell division protein FtsA